ncbi:alpha/beta hydrolase fold protein [Arcobacter nitrofigilis DSM 7299]|uniref:Alpha/beta hydrolase fold protein n=1 Tax=Arcobacter nitrofigilis (strain ATCC 33309 / DSM 7299 / CCUG 15893 / LMG 7604 / NCTC 12251 / CI) TaxID=572480 RepID=D5V2E8_ARCNC|nr:alpha/beta hydrolase [Arcobacter nitrofigilis]ADG92381.1 alpha/beta hydrolase fold protein [Arcobacter nitrofigilis DSM 7299]
MIENIKPTNTFEFDGRSVLYGKFGKGPALVIVHGTPWSSFNLRHLIKKLSQEYTVYYYDLLGYGCSSKALGDVSLGMQNRLLKALLEYWNLDNPFVIGHDFGGAIVLRTHLLNNQDFKKIVLIDPVAVSPWGSPFFKHVNKFEEAFAGVPDYIHESIIQAYVKTAIYKPLEEEVLNKTLSFWTKDGGKEAFYRQIAQADSKYTDEVQSLYHTIKVPVEIIWGKEDSWIPLEKGKELHKMIPNSVFHIIDDAGHLIIEEKPDELIEKILPFLQK